MYPATIALAALLLALSVIIRSVDIFRFYALGVDTFANLLYSQMLRDRSLNLYKVGKIVYPPFLPRLLYYLRHLPVRTLHVIPKLFDILTSITVFLFTLWFSGDEFVAFLALLIYTFSPINVVNGYGIGTRNIGSFFFVFTILASYVAMFDAQVRYTMFVLAIASCILMMLTSRIAYKSYFLFVIVSAFLLPLDSSFGMLLLVSAISLALSVLITHGEFINDLKGHIFLINFFRMRKIRKSVLKQAVLVFYNNLWWCVGILAIINGATPFLATWLSTMIALSLVWPWGEGERHIALGTAPASILAASYLSQRLFLIIPILLLEISIIIRTSVKVLQGKYLVSVDRPLLNLFNALKRVEENSLFLCLPPVYSAPAAYFTGKKVLYGESSSEEGVLFQAEVLDALKTQEGVDMVAFKYSVTHIFVDKDNFPVAISSNRWYPIIQQDRFTVLRRKSPQEK